MKCSRPTHRDSGRPVLIARAAPSSPSTNSTCATIWNPYAGTNSRPRRSCRLKWRTRPAKNIARLTAYLPASNYELARHTSRYHPGRFRADELSQRLVARSNRPGIGSPGPGSWYLVLWRRRIVSAKLRQLPEGGELRRILSGLYRGNAAWRLS